MNPDTLFYAVCINSLVSTLCFCGAMAYTECVIIKVVFTRSKGYTYGEQKVFGPIGAGLGVFLAGVAIDHYKPKHLSKYLAAFYLYVPISLLMLPLLYILTKQADWNFGKRKKSERKVPVVKDIIMVSVLWVTIYESTMGWIRVRGRSRSYLGEGRVKGVFGLLEYESGQKYAGFRD